MKPGPSSRVLAPNLTAVSQLSISMQAIYSQYHFERVKIGLGFRPNQEVGADPLIWAFVFNPLLESGERKDAAVSAVQAVADERVGIEWGEYPSRYRPAVDVLTASDFRAQAREAVAFTRETLELFSTVGYVSASEVAASPL